ncbi:hypothetical protein CC78DRAFT_579693 [Lojkania enalia]|uniref:F-box domain-containing protein n=1 Tax=Lojkania enalia TaxID=147567 RepID=A0A9P4KEL2_9PLEO|nr:hypothetical protein CC78DRAFT_579693 [Didymosphaeria enalia]
MQNLPSKLHVLITSFLNSPDLGDLFLTCSHLVPLAHAIKYASPSVPQVPPADQIVNLLCALYNRPDLAKLVKRLGPTIIGLGFLDPTHALLILKDNLKLPIL